jgi:CheY-like chemotaxis protein/anti-sigma regulatory factor (Ser/Thr protein kinase)
MRDTKVDSRTDVRHPCCFISGPLSTCTRLGPIREPLSPIAGHHNMTSILVVDDSAMDRTLIGGLLERELEVAVLQASDGCDALRQFESHIPDIVVTDLVMPDMNGLELIEVLTKGYPLTPVVMLTARGNEEIAVTALEKGAASYVPKRAMAWRLPHTVTQILEASREEKKLAKVLQRMVADECEFVVENDLTLICTLVRYFHEGMRGVKLGDASEQMRMSIALEEALLNAFYHGNLEISSELREDDNGGFDRLARQRAQEPPYCDRRIYVKAKFSESGAEFVVRDDGAGFDVTQLPDPTDAENLLRPSGRGLLLMQSFMDEIHYNATGNEVTMVKHRRAADGPVATGDGRMSAESDASAGQPGAVAKPPPRSIQKGRPP